MAGGMCVCKGIVKDFGKVMYELLYLKWITNKFIVKHMEHCSMLCACLDGSEIWGTMDTCICITESLQSSPETITALLINYTPIQNAFGVKQRNKNKIKRNKIKPCLTPWNKFD